MYNAVTSKVTSRVRLKRWQNTELIVKMCCVFDVYRREPVLLVVVENDQHISIDFQ